MVLECPEAQALRAAAAAVLVLVVLVLASMSWRLTFELSRVMQVDFVCQP